MIEFRTEGTNIPLFILNLAISFLQMLLGLCLVFGFRFSKEKRRKQKELEKAFRESQDKKWARYSAENTKIVTEVHTIRDSSGNVYQRDIYSWVETPGRRAVSFTVGIALSMVPLLFVVKKIIDFSAIPGGLVVLGLSVYIWKKYKSHLLYDRWYMRLIYCFACLFFLGFAMAYLVDKIMGGNKY